MARTGTASHKNSRAAADAHTLTEWLYEQLALAAEDNALTPRVIEAIAAMHVPDAIRLFSLTMLRPGITLPRLDQ